MNPVSTLSSLLQEQWDGINSLVEYEQFCESPIAWCKRVGRTVGASHRRGWTRQDINRGKYFGNGPTDFASHRAQNSPTGRMDSRIPKYVRLTRFVERATEYASTALDYCDTNSRFPNVVQPCVGEMLAIHLEWLAWVDDHALGFCETEWLRAKSRLDGVSEMLLAVEALPTDPLTLIETQLESRYLPIWQVLKQHGRRRRITLYSEIHSHLADNGETAITDASLTKYLKAIAETCEQFDVELERPKRGKKVYLKI